MRTYFLLVSFIVVTLCLEVLGVGGNEIKRGVFPFMAFLYYPDETVLDSTGSRFMRSAVLIRPDWLLTSAIGSNVLNNESEDFPKKTLLARLGAITIDSKFTLNEDEDEQEREIVQIVRPLNHSATQWWRTDITLMKTLLPFNMTSAVKSFTLNYKQKPTEKTCIVLVYARKSSNFSEDVVLMQLSVELSPPSMENCGRYFVENTMACGTDSDETKNAVYDSEYCRSNSGGPLICEEEVIGLQTYIDNNCHQPHLYQLLAAWKIFITCGTEEKCQDEQCSEVCVVSDKDVTMTEDIFTITLETETQQISLVDTKTIPTKALTSPTISVATIELEEKISPTLTIHEETTTKKTTAFKILHTPAKTSHRVETTSQVKSWPKEHDSVKLGENDENIERKANVEAQQKESTLKVYSAAKRNIYKLGPVFFGIVILLYSY